MVSVQRPQEIAFFRGKDVTITGDARAFPLVLVHTRGEVDTGSFDSFFAWRAEWIDYAASTAVRMIQISLTDSMKPPSAMVRKHIAEKAKNDDKIEALMCTYMVVPSALLRGVVTAVMWVAGSAGNVKNFGSLAEAVESANRLFSDIGVKPPKFDYADYTVPTGS